MFVAPVVLSDCVDGAGTSSGQCHPGCGLKAVEDILVDKVKMSGIGILTNTVGLELARVKFREAEGALRW